MARKKQTAEQEITGNSEPEKVITPEVPAVAAQVPAQKPVKPVRKRLRIRKKGPKKLSVAVLCSNIGFSRFA